MKNKVITLSLAILTATVLLIGCGSMNNKEEATTVEEITETEETTTVEEITDEENSTTDEETTETKDTEYGTELEDDPNDVGLADTSDAIIDGDMVFASDVDPADKNQIMKAREVQLADMDFCDENSDGLIDKDEAKEVASMIDNDMIESWKDFISGKDISEYTLDKSTSSSSSSSSNSSSTSGLTQQQMDELIGATPDNTANTPQLHGLTDEDFEGLRTDVTVY
jgi:hypothetical protein